jgi:hypothetical protein
VIGFCLEDDLRILGCIAGDSGVLSCPVESEVTVEAYERLKKIVIELEDDIKKAEGGNKAAGTRVRSVMQDVKGAAQEIREAILAMRSTTEKSEPGGGN